MGVLDQVANRLQLAACRWSLATVADSYPGFRRTIVWSVLCLGRRKAIV
jgi:hypothetical protein